VPSVARLLLDDEQRRHRNLADLLVSEQGNAIVGAADTSPT
jgi:hypothetical protein